MSQRLVVITGSSGVGKSSLARALQEQLLPDQWLHFSADTLFYCLPRSTVERADQQNDWSQVDSNAIVAGALACARTLLAHGHSVIFDAVVVTEVGARNLLGALAEFEPLIVELTCSWEQIEKRTLARGDRTLAEARHGYRLAGGHLCPHHAFDTTELSPEQVAAHLVARMRNSAA